MGKPVERRLRLVICAPPLRLATGGMLQITSAVDGAERASRSLRDKAEGALAERSSGCVVVSHDRERCDEES